MFGLGMPEILLILAIALMVIGPKKLPDLAKTLGRAMGEFKKATHDFKESLDVDNTVNEFKDPIKTVTDDFKSASDAMNPLSTDATGEPLDKSDPLEEDKEDTESDPVKKDETDALKSTSDATTPLFEDATGEILDKSDKLKEDTESESDNKDEEKVVSSSLDPFPEENATTDSPENDTPHPTVKDKDEKGI